MANYRPLIMIRGPQDIGIKSEPTSRAKERFSRQQRAERPRRQPKPNIVIIEKPPVIIEAVPPKIEKRKCFGGTFKRTKYKKRRSHVQRHKKLSWWKRLRLWLSKNNYPSFT